MVEMSELRVLDMSEDRDHHPFDMLISIGSKTNEFLNRESVLENLTALDISGKFTKRLFVETEVQKIIPYFFEKMGLVYLKFIK